jgi:hypothetical protein
MKVLNKDLQRTQNEQLNNDVDMMPKMAESKPNLGEHNHENEALNNAKHTGPTVLANSTGQMTLGGIKDAHPKIGNKAEMSFGEINALQKDLKDSAKFKDTSDDKQAIHNQKENPQLKPSETTKLQEKGK